MTFFLITWAVISPAEGSKVTRDIPDLSGSINTDNPEVNPGDGSSEYKCPPDSKKCSCKGEYDCFSMGKDGVCKSGTIKPDGSGGATCTRKF